MTSGHAPTALIADYAAGVLPEGMSLAVACHLTYCPCCSDKVSRLEALCGALLAEGDAVPPAARCLKGALARIAHPDHGPPCGPPRAPLPAPICRRIGMPLEALAWRELRPGIAAFWLEGFPAERVGLVRADPGAAVEAHGHSAPEATLVLTGKVRYGERTYCRGDLAFAGMGVVHAPEAVGTETCLCLVVLAGGAGVTR